MLFRAFSRLFAEDKYDDRYKILLREKDLSDRLLSIYTILNVLDSKASALMRLDGVLLATAFVGVVANIYIIKSCEFAVIALPCLLSMFLCLLVVSVDWPFLGYVNNKAGVMAELRMLRRVRRFRELAYRTAWLGTFVSIIALTVVVIRAMR